MKSPLQELHFRTFKVEQIAPSVFNSPNGYVAFHSNADGKPVSVAQAREFVSAPEGTYPVAIALQEYEMYRLTLPEVAA